MSRRVLITGGGSGLGRELARLCLARGDRVAIADIHAPRLTATADELGDSVLAIHLDVTKAEQWQHAMETLHNQWGGLDLLVNNAGIASGGPMQAESVENWQRVIDINLLGVVRGAQAAHQLLAQSQGQLLNVASMAGLIHPPMMGSYNAVKAAVVAYSETLAFEWEPEHIGVHVLCPGFFATNLAESLPDSDPALKAVIERVFAKARMTATDVAQVALRGLENGDFLILSHPEGKQAHRLKRWFPTSLYRQVMKKQTRGLLKAWKQQ
nr:SDR family NAD(P)-dependent oxidoreductase [Oceanococcus sp. HetDA_MAG_MS8]